MAHPNKVKGDRFERELVTQAKKAGLTAERAYGSNGRALGQAETVDLLVGGLRVQAKRRKALPAYLVIPKGADVVAIREDRGETLAIITYSRLLDLLGGYQL